MRRTLTIDDDALAAAKGLASSQHESVGEVISALAKQALRPNLRKGKARSGVPVLPVRAAAAAVTTELVNQLRDELPG